jgi:hypothetical protein
MKTYVKVYCILIINIVSMHFLDAQSPVYFTKTFDIGEVKSMIAVHDSVHGTCYVIAGISGSVDGNGFLMKVDAYGDTLWSRSYGSSKYEIINAVKQTADQGYILVGEGADHVSGVYPALVIKTDANGDVEWSHSYQGTGNGPSYMNGIQIFDVEVLDDGYLLAGTSRAFQSSPYFTMWVARISLSGQFIWSRTYFNSGVGRSIRKTADGGFVIAQEHLQGNMALTKIDSVGNTLWIKTYGGPDQDFANTLISTTTGYLMVGGTISSGFPGSYAMYVVKTDFNGDYKWSRRTNGQVQPISYGALENADRGFVIAGAWSGRFGFLKLDSVGNLLWANELGNNMTSYSRANQIISVPGGFFVAGELESQLSLIRIDSLGYPACHGYPTPVVSTVALTQTATISASDSLVIPQINVPNLEVSSGTTMTTICAINHPVSPHNRLKIINILAPATPLPSGTPLYPSFRVKNYSTDTITGFDFFFVYTQLDGFGTPPHVSTPETWNGMLLPNQQLDIVMNEQISVYFGMGELCVRLMVTGDTINGADTLCTQTGGFTNVNEAGKKADDFRLFPNPSTGEITTNEEGKLIFFNLAGKHVYEKEVQPNEKIMITLPAGVYIYTINHKKGKLIVL